MNTESEGEAEVHCNDSDRKNLKRPSYTGIATSVELEV